MVGSNLRFNNFMVAAVIIFGIGFTMLFLNRNLVKKIIGFNFMDSGIFLFLASNGYIEDRISPIIQGGEVSVSNYINPIPAGLVLTGIVVSVSVTAVLLALTVRLYLRYHTLELDEIYVLSKHQMEDR